ncbi:MAG: DUF3298 domain-containing protein [Bacteroidales bacterium]|nr:DUF3298 domain-containing protein [Bacteroidales bacterium]
MRSIRFVAAASAAVLLLAGCTHEMKTAMASDELFLPLKEGSETGLSADYAVEYITGGLPADVTGRINAAIVSDLLYDNAEDGMSVPEACKRWMEIYSAGYRTDVEELQESLDLEEEGWMYNWEYSVSGAFTTACKQRNWQTYCSSASDYEGGAHGMYGETHLVFDLATGLQVKEADFLDMSREDEIADLLHDAAVEVFEEDEETADAMYGDPHPNGNFSVSDEGVCWHFNPYEIAPYAMGVVAVELTWGQLEPFLLK